MLAYIYYILIGQSAQNHHSGTAYSVHCFDKDIIPNVKVVSRIEFPKTSLMTDMVGMVVDMMVDMMVDIMGVLQLMY